MKTAHLIAAAALLALSGRLIPAQKARPAVSGYLTGSAIPDLIRILPTPPEPGTARATADRAIFRATRSLQDSPRWKLAQSDDDDTVPGMLAAFSCSSELALTRESAPRTAALLERVSVDVNTATGPAKTHFHRKRPFLNDEGTVCLPRPQTPDFPSSHSALGLATGLILEELLSERSTEILVRARVFGESRVVCGMHNASAVEAGRIAGASVVAALHSLDQFRADMEAAKSELARVPHHQPGAASRCAAEEALTAVTPY